MIKHETTIHINRPVEEVFAFLTDGRNLTKWQADVIEYESESGEPLRAGSRFRELRRIRGRPTEIRSNVTAFEPNQRFAVETDTSPKVSVSYSFQPRNGGTQVTQVFVMKTSGLMRLMEPLISGPTKQGVKADLEKLKEILESR